MAKFVFNLILLVVIIIVFIFIYAYHQTGDPLSPFQTSPPQYVVNIQPIQRNQRNENTEDVVFITPSNVQLIREKYGQLRDDQFQRLSPNSSLSMSSVNPVNIQFPTICHDKKVFVFKEAERKFGSLPEKKLCKIFEEYLERPVVVHFRPDFLKNPRTGRNLELDMYDPETKIGIEYNGKQHYEYVPSMHKDLADFEYQVWRDKLKIELCSKEGVILIIVPYTIDTMDYGKNGKLRNIRLTDDQKEKKLKAFVTPFLDGAMKEVHRRKLHM